MRCPSPDLSPDPDQSRWSNALDIDIPVMEGKVWVCSEYIRMFKFAEEFYAENESNFTLSPGLVITGQPGVGKFY